MTDKETPVVAILFFKIKPKVYPANLRSLSIIPFALEGKQNSLLKDEKNACGSHFIFQNEAKNIPRQDFMVMNISCKFEKPSYNIFLLVR